MELDRETAKMRKMQAEATSLLANWKHDVVCFHLCCHFNFHKSTPVLYSKSTCIFLFNLQVCSFSLISLMQNSVKMLRTCRHKPNATNAPREHTLTLDKAIWGKCLLIPSLSISFLRHCNTASLSTWPSFRRLLTIITYSVRTISRFSVYLRIGNRAEPRRWGTRWRLMPTWRTYGACN